jgi:hypothetical protein
MDDDHQSILARVCAEGREFMHGSRNFDRICRLDTLELAHQSQGEVEIGWYAP